jgi:quercetin dioxygenase-like cupin family protein
MRRSSRAVRFLCITTARTRSTIIFEGELEYEVGDETRLIGAGVLIQIPAEVNHRVRNRSERPARLVFFFDSPRDVVVFDEPLMPMDATILGGEG